MPAKEVTSVVLVGGVFVGIILTSHEPKS